MSGHRFLHLKVEAFPVLSIAAACLSKTIPVQAIQDTLPLDRLNACHPHVLIILGDIILLPLRGVMGLPPLASGTLVLRRVILVLAVALPAPPVAMSMVT